MSADGSKYQFWDMPLIGGKVTGVGLANLFKEISALCKEPPKYYIERVQAMKHDGKVGMATYFRSAGLMEMPHLWGWPIITVPPSVWCRKMHATYSQKIHPKEKSLLYISQHFPKLYEKGSLIWPDRRQKPHMGRVDSFMIARYALGIEYGIGS